MRNVYLIICGMLFLVGVPVEAMNKKNIKWITLNSAKMNGFYCDIQEYNDGKTVVKRYRNKRTDILTFYRKSGKFYGRTVDLSDRVVNKKLVSKVQKVLTKLMSLHTDRMKKFIQK